MSYKERSKEMLGGTVLGSIIGFVCVGTRLFMKNAGSTILKGAFVGSVIGVVYVGTERIAERVNLEIKRGQKQAMKRSMSYFHNFKFMN